MNLLRRFIGRSILPRCTIAALPPTIHSPVSHSPRLSLTVDPVMHQTKRPSPAKGHHKPPVPYQKNTYLTIQKIQPAPPFTVFYWDFMPEGMKTFIERERTASEDDLKHLPVVDFCLSQKPLPTTSLHEATDLHILDTLAVGDGRGSQVLTCTTSIHPDKVLVAKIYDPLYYPRVDEEFPDKAFDVVYSADADFTSEAAAYEYLNVDFGGVLIPQYHGAWSFTQTLRGKPRTVNLILIEHVQGVPLSHFDPASCTKSERWNILGRRMEAEFAFYRHGFSHFDLAPRNIIVAPGYQNSNDMNLQIRVIDFNNSKISALAGAGKAHRGPRHPKSLISYWEGDYPDHMADWLDDSIYKDMDGWNAWMRQRWGES